MLQYAHICPGRVIYNDARGANFFGATVIRTTKVEPFPIR